MCIRVGCCEDRRKGAPHLGGSTFLHERERMYLFVYVGAQWMYVGVIGLFFVHVDVFLVFDAVLYL